MHSILLAIGVTVAVQGATGGPDKAVMAAVHQFVDAFNKGDTNLTG